MFQKAKSCACKKKCPTWAGYAIAFGLGMTISTFGPADFLFFIAAVIITALGIVLVRQCC